MNRKYIICLFLVIALCLSLAACGKKAGQEASPAGTQTESGAKPEAGSEPQSPSEGGEESGQHEPTPREIAASMQDYTIGENGKAAPVSTVDDNYLILVNKTHPLSRDYWPDDMVTVSKTLLYVVPGSGPVMTSSVDGRSSLVSVPL